MDSFTFKSLYADQCSSLSDAEFGRLIRAVVRAVRDGKRTNMTGREAIAYDFITCDILQANAPKRSRAVFTPPTAADVAEYINANGYNVSPESFVDFYTANGWVQGRAGKPIKDWKAAVRMWHRTEQRKSTAPSMELGEAELSAIQRVLADV